MKTDSLETELRQALADRADEVPDEAVERLQRRRYRPRSPRRVGMVSAGLTGAAAAATVLGIAMTQPASHHGSDQSSAPSSHHSSAAAKTQLAAWTVTKQANGTVIITIRQLSDPAGMQAKLRAAGIPASVSDTGNPACTQYLLPTHGRTSLQLRAGGTANVTKLVLRPSALPGGAGLQIVVIKPGNDIISRFVQVSPQCTGS